MAAASTSRFKNVEDEDIISLLESKDSQNTKKKFYVGIRKKDGGLYKLKSFQLLKWGVARYIRETLKMDITKSEFKASNDVFKAKVVELQKSGKDTKSITFKNKSSLDNFSDSGFYNDVETEQNYSLKHGIGQELKERIIKDNGSHHKNVNVGKKFNSDLKQGRGVNSFLMEYRHRRNVIKACQVFYLSANYSSITSNPDVIKLYGYYFLVPNITQNDRPIYVHESNSAFLKFICFGESINSCLWGVSGSVNIVDTSYELSVLDTALTPVTITEVVWTDGMQEIVSRIKCDDERGQRRGRLLILDNNTDNRFSYLRGLYNTTGDVINHRPVYQWMKPTLGYISIFRDLHLYYLSTSSEWVLGQGTEGKTIICRVTDPVLYPTNITRAWMCADFITDLTIPEPFHFLHFVPKPEPTTQNILMTSWKKAVPSFTGLNF
ncbi:unnamed protein product [Owenia fusiformis]|uniref:Uncharacterized protein n=1 Tax=Owenia fusiformis TaxID=6347 RepID=A0A8S4NLE7_OWEFU|nr:unnamed protein product [Owenia fusiformis]